ncbi:AI-2E family transporter [Maribius pontilimi]|uniref:AI-2E family transporter n=1 Tax=Palleronia pontilimi TaxID=1964209 RepID=A0A934IEG8_9RHOB|nr:AI-2E family transporter [Palleronia pontilimi]MBJ3762952.1 AI-2E family transporter [Palleronia pontilimi]
MQTLQTERIRTAAHVCLIVIGVIAVAAAMRVAQNVLAPTILAFVVGIVLSPISDFWERIGAPRAVGALISLLLTLSIIALIASLMLPIIGQVVDAWPVIRAELRGFMFEIQGTLRGIEDAGEEMERAMGGDGQDEGDGDGGFSIPSTTDALFLAPSVAGQTITFAGVLFFFVLTRRDIYGWVARRLAPKGAEETTALRLLLAERQVARYFLTISLVNIVFGLAVALIFYLIGMPSFYIWGAATTLLNFVLYLGPAVLFVSLCIAGVVVFEGAMSAAPALSFLALNLIEAQFLTPAAIGASLSLNPLMVFVSLVFFLWLWGPLGGFIAIPLVLWVLVISNMGENATTADLEEVAASQDRQPGAS